MSSTKFTARTLFETRPGTTHDSWLKSAPRPTEARLFDTVPFNVHSQRFH